MHFANVRVTTAWHLCATFLEGFGCSAYKKHEHAAWPQTKPVVQSLYNSMAGTSCITAAMLAGNSKDWAAGVVELCVNVRLTSMCAGG